MLTLLSYDHKQGIKVYHDLSEILDKINDVKGSIFWLDFATPKDTEVSLLKEVFQFHPLAIEDCLYRLQRPKIDEYDNYFFMVMHAFSHHNPDEPVEFDIFISNNFIVTFHWKPLSFIDSLVERFVKNPVVFEKGVDFLLYSITDALVDEYFPLMDDIEDKLSEIEEATFKHPDRHLASGIFEIKRKILNLRKTLSAQREVFNLLLRHDFPYIREESRLFFMDVYDHIFRLFDSVDLFFERASGALESYLTVVSNLTNEIMKVLTIFTALMMPLSLIAGIYGMNFRYMPELSWRWGYPFALLLMALTALGLLYYFRKKKWI
ncbi:MAG TPA: magnesium/cobalt transporter CorA [Thermoanaerobacterales bacterium]|nr:magnesium/cobalt transporter CorA [Thermoanaerobacterales bacterium]